MSELAVIFKVPRRGFVAVLVMSGYDITKIKRGAPTYWSGGRVTHANRVPNGIPVLPPEVMKSQPG